MSTDLFEVEAGNWRLILSFSLCTVTRSKLHYDMRGVCSTTTADLPPLKCHKSSLPKVDANRNTLLRMQL